MSGSPIVFKSMRIFWGLFLIGAVLTAIVTYLTTRVVMLASGFDYLAVILCFFGIAAFVASAGFFLGWKAKKSAVLYAHANWQFQTIDLESRECRSLIRNHIRRYGRMVSVSRLWYFYLPVILVTLNLSFPYCSSFVNQALAPFIPLFSVLVVLAIDTVSFYGGFRATSNSATSDFQLPLIREAIWLADTQSSIPSFSLVRIALDEGRSGEFTAYRNPRVIAHVSGFENEVYLESTSEELKSLGRVFCGLRGSDGSWAVSWLWESRDRNFLRRTPDDKEGYYVRNPVPSRVRQLGVKDVRLVTKNAIALVIIECLRTGAGGQLARDMLSALGIESYA